MSRGCGSPDTPWGIRYDILDLLREIPVKASLTVGNVCNQMTIRKGLRRPGEVCIVDETNGFGLDFVEKTESGFLECHPRHMAYGLVTSNYPV